MTDDKNSVAASSGPTTSPMTMVNACATAISYSRCLLTALDYPILEFDRSSDMQLSDRIVTTVLWKSGEAATTGIENARTDRRRGTIRD